MQPRKPALSKLKTPAAPSPEFVVLKPKTHPIPEFMLGPCNGGDHIQPPKEPREPVTYHVSGSYYDRFPDGLSVSDLYAAMKLAQILSEMLPVLIDVPGFASICPPTRTRGVHGHPTFRLVSGYLSRLGTILANEIHGATGHAPEHLREFERIVAARKEGAA